MRTVIGVVILVLFMTLASATEYYVDIYEGIGAGSGDDSSSGEQEEEEEEEEEEEDEEDDGGNGGGISKTRRTKSLISLGDKVVIEIDDFAIASNTLSVMNENASVSDTAKEPVDWGPIVVWGIIITVAVLLLIGGWYIYQIYFY